MGGEGKTEEGVGERERDLLMIIAIMAIIFFFTCINRRLSWTGSLRSTFWSEMFLDVSSISCSCKHSSGLSQFTAMWKR